MLRTLPAAVLLLVFAAPSSAEEAAPRDYKKAAGPAEVAVKKVEWRDAKRDREVPAKLYFPAAGKGPFPVLLFSHGLGGSRDGYEYLGRHWASHGYVAVHLQHRGSDDAVWKGSKKPLDDLRKAVWEPANALHRPLDVRFALDQLTKMNAADKDLKGRLDLARVGLAGHSFGGFTTQAAIGQVFVLPLGKEVTFREPRVKAAVILSPSPPPDKSSPAKAFGKIKVPCLHMTGTEDDGVGIVEMEAAQRRVPFDHIKGAEQYLVIFKGGDHMVFAAPKRRKPGEGKKDAVFLDLVRMATTAFWDAHLKGDAGARAWLAGGGLKKALGEEGTFERRAAGK
jgi:predicted dienelactone hydrolase